MKIIYRNDNKVRFEELAEGTIFRGGDGQVYMKTSYAEDNCYNSLNAVDLVTGSLEYFGDNDLVTVVKGAFVEE